MARALAGATFGESFGSPWMRLAGDAGALADRQHIRGIGSHAFNAAERAGVITFGGIVAKVEDVPPVADEVVDLPPLPQEDQEALQEQVADISRYLSKQALAGASKE